MHILILALMVPRPQTVGKFRGEAGLENVGVRIGAHRGTPSRLVAAALRAFELKLQDALARLDQLIPRAVPADAALVAAILDVAAWAHAEWVRIHPFANGNGRTARLWANYIAMRYGLPPFVALRPRPDQGYAQAAEAAMRSDWQPTATLFRRLLQEVLSA